MRLFEIDDISPATLKHYVDLIKQDCQPFLTAVPNIQTLPLFRGLRGIDDAFTKLKVPINRRPKNTQRAIHQFLTSAFKYAGFIASRDNSMFCTGMWAGAKSYGDVFMVFPIGEFQFTWSPSIHDLYNDLYSAMIEMQDKESIERYVKKIEEDNPRTFGHLAYSAIQMMSDSNMAILDQNREDRDNNNYQAIIDKFWNLFYNNWIKNPNTYSTLINAMYMGESELIQTISEDQLVAYIKRTYKNTDMEAAIKSHNEIMIHCDEYYAVTIHDNLYMDVLELL